ncbi:sensor histidine kinase [Winogradskyella sp. A2]|uniref:sensor histidine kinase n=1 Tax=Winogradskyella sp. A2 TaxID=3366944 RepID=UPI00398C78B9
MLWKKLVAYVIPLSFFVGFGQSICDCKLLSNSYELSLKPSLDSLDIQNTLEQFYPSKKEQCRLFSDQLLQFTYFYNQRNEEKMNTLLSLLDNVEKNSICSGQIQAYININKAKYYRTINQFDSLGKFAFNTLKYAETHKDTILEIEAIKQLVFMYTRMDEEEQRWNNVQRAKRLILNLKDYPSVSSNYRWLGYQYENQYSKTENIGLLDSTEIFIKKAKKLALSYHYSEELAKNYRALEAVSYHRGNLEVALKHIDSAIYYAKQVKGRLNFSGLYLSKAWDHFDLNQYKEAEIFTDSMLYYDDQSDYVGSMMTLSQAAELYEGIGKTDKAFESFKKYSKIKDSIFTKQRIKAINELEKKYDVEKKEKELLKNENKIKLLYLLIIAGFSLAVFTFLLFKNNQLKRERELNLQLQQALNNQATLELEISNARENIAQDFHDEMGNKLARITLLSNLLQDNTSQNLKAKSKIQQITDDAKALYFGTRDFIFSLKSNSDCLDEVITYLSDFGEDFFSKSDIRFILKQDIESNIKLPFYWSKQLVFIFKEAMTNALKYAQCTEVCLSFHHKNEQLTISFEDNGQGIPEDRLNSYNGLNHMKQRAKKIGCTLIINTKKDSGTQIIFKGKTTSKGGIC